MSNDIFLSCFSIIDRHSCTIISLKYRYIRVNIINDTQSLSSSKPTKHQLFTRNKRKQIYDTIWGIIEAVKKLAWSTRKHIVLNICTFLRHESQYPELQLISYERYLECTLVQWRLSIYPRGHIGSCVGTFFMKSPVCICIMCIPVWGIEDWKCSYFFLSQISQITTKKLFYQNILLSCYYWHGLALKFKLKHQN